MNESYDVGSVIIGKIYVCKQLGGSYGLIKTKSEQFYLFYKQNTRGKRLTKNTKLAEVFTEDEYEIYSDELENNHTFNKPYIVDVESITPYLTQDEIKSKQISKWRIVEIYNTINFPKKVKKKTK